MPNDNLTVRTDDFQHYEYASFSVRLLAQNIDLVVFVGLAYLLNYLIADDYLLYTCLVVSYYIYNTSLELSSWRGSLGKKLSGIQVLVPRHDRDLGFLLLRNFLKFFSLLLLFSGFVMISFNRKRQALHDMLSGSVVIIGQK